MKNCNEMIESLFERKSRYEAEKKRKNKMLIRTLTPICCVCLVALVGLGLWQGDFFKKQPEQTLEDSVTPGTKDWYGPDEIEISGEAEQDNEKKAAKLVYNGRTYVQNTSKSNKEIVPDKKIGIVSDYLTGTYSIVQSGEDAIRITISPNLEVYTVKDKNDVIMVKLENGDCALFVSKD